MESPINKESEKSKEGKKVVYIMRGIPGGGKSTKAREIAGSEGVIHSTDDFFTDEKGEYNFQPEKLPEFHQRNQEAFLQSLKEGKSPVIVDNTNIARWHYEPYEKMAREHGYDVVFFNMPKISAEEAEKRNTHNVPPESIKRMIEGYEEDPLG